MFRPLSPLSPLNFPSYTLNNKFGKKVKKMLIMHFFLEILNALKMRKAFWYKSITTNIKCIELEKKVQFK